MKNNSEEKVIVGGNRYSKDTVERAKKLVDQYGFDLEETIKEILSVTETIRNANSVDPRAKGYGLSGYGIKFIPPWDKKV